MTKHIKELLKELDEAEDDGMLKDSQIDYVASIAEFYDDYGYVTPKQLKTIQSIHDEVFE